MGQLVNTQPNLSQVEWDKINEIRAKRIQFLNEQSKRWKVIPEDQTHVSDYKRFQTLDGEGVRHSLYFSGCSFNCLGCYNVASQSKTNGVLYSQELEDKIITDLQRPRVAGITFVGGSPFLNAPKALVLAKRIKNECPGKTIWSYTGYLWETLIQFSDEDPRRQLLEFIDVLIDGPFIQELRDEGHLQKFRGSSNQRLINVQDSLTQQTIVLHDDNWR